MKALTVWQPWASLIVAGVKPYEFRCWPAPRAVRGLTIALHAGARPVRRRELEELMYAVDRPGLRWTTALKPEALPLLERWWRDPSALPLASVLGTAVLGEPRSAWEIAAEFGTKVQDSDRDAHDWAWPLTDIRPLEPIAPARGARGFWTWDWAG